MKRLLLIGALSIAACKGRQASTGPVAETPVNTEQEKPSWVRARPVTDQDYVGIGLCPKNRSDYQESAKKNALNDLASEISVKVEGNSLLYTLDRKNAFDESFTSTIKTSSDERLEGYELVDSYDSPTDHWVYYRLNKAEHARIKAEKKRQAIANATDLFTRSQQSLAGGDLKGAFDQDLRALLAMKDYWGENDLTTIGDKQVPVVNEIYNDLQKLTSGVRLSALPERCRLDYTNRFKREMLVSAGFSDGKRTRDLAQLPLLFSYPGINGKVGESRSTDAEGHARTTLQRIDLTSTARELSIRLDVEGLASKDLDPAFVNPLLGSLTIPELRVPIDVDMPRIRMQATETNLGQPVNDAGIAIALKEELTTKGFRFVESASEADLLMTVKSGTREGGEASGFFTAYLDVSCAFRDRKSGDTIYEGGKQSVKGVQLTYPKAGMAAYTKASQELRGDLVAAMLNALL